MIPRPLNRRCREAAFYKRLEPYAGKLARTVLRGENGSNVIFLLDVFKCTQSLLNSKSKQYPSHYGSDRTARYKADIAVGKTCCDCVGVCKGYAWNNGKKKSEVPGKSANGMFDWAKKKGAEWGAIGTIPEVPGVAVRFDGHVGYYVGNGYVIEWRGFNYGCVRTKFSGRKWTHWYRLPWIDYGVGALLKAFVLGERELRKGITGNDVKDMQTRLKELGYDLGKYGIDGDFGSDTQAAVMKFQEDNGLEATGVYGAATHEKLVSSPAASATNTPVTDNPTPSIPSGLTVEIVTKNGGTVNVRVGNGTEYEIIKELSTGEVLEYIATAGNGWNAVKVGSQVGWVSGEYSKKTD